MNRLLLETNGILCSEEARGDQNPYQRAAVTMAKARAKNPRFCSCFLIGEIAMALVVLLLNVVSSHPDAPARCWLCENMAV